MKPDLAHEKRFSDHAKKTGFRHTIKYANLSTALLLLIMHYMFRPYLTLAGQRPPGADFCPCFSQRLWQYRLRRKQVFGQSSLLSESQ